MEQWFCTELNRTLPLPEGQGHRHVCTCENCCDADVKRLKGLAQQATELRTVLDANAKEMAGIIEKQDTKQHVLHALLKQEREMVKQMQLAMDDMEHNMEKQRDQKRHREEQAAAERKRQEMETFFSARARAISPAIRSRVSS